MIVANGAPYGSESLFNSLRLAICVTRAGGNLDLRLFLMSDAVTAGLRGQKPGEGYNIQQMLEDPYRSRCTGEIVQNLY